MRNAVGLDISQDTFDAAVIINGCRKDARFNNNAKGFDDLKTWLDSFGFDDLHICMEATGNYFEDVADYIGRHYKVSVINPYKISEYGKSRFHRTKTDKQDARLIAEYCHTAMPKDLPLRKTISNGHSRLKRVLALYNQLTEERTAQKNRLRPLQNPHLWRISVLCAARSFAYLYDMSAPAVLLPLERHPHPRVLQRSQAESRQR